MVARRPKLLLRPVKLFALSDPHLSFGVPGRSMDRFGPEWVSHPERIKAHWEAVVGPKDVVVVPGDISWAKKFPAALEDLKWLGQLPGRKVILQGNHDIWWPSVTLLDQELPPNMHFVQNNHVRIGPFLFFGTRLWDTDEYSLFDLIEWDPNKGEIPGVLSDNDRERQNRIYDRELLRLQLSIQSIPGDFKGMRIGLSHYPPLNHELKPSRASQLYQQAGATHVIFGHLHSVKTSQREKAFGTLDGVTYHLTSCDLLGMKPKFICEVEEASSVKD
jgi:uncharacterized protein